MTPLALGWAAVVASTAALGQLIVVNPLPPEQLRTLYHLPEGGATMPLDFYYSMEVIDSITGQRTGQTFPERMASYGFLDDPDHEFPVGFDVVTLEFLNNIEGFSINCSACHVGEIHYGGRRLRIIGGPNLADIRRFSQDTYYSMRRALLTPGTLLRLLVRSDRLERETKEALAAMPLIEAGRFDFRTDGPEGDALLRTIAEIATSRGAPMRPANAPFRVEWGADDERRPAVVAQRRRPRVDGFLAPARGSPPGPAVDLVRNVSLLFAEADYFLAQGRFPLSTREGYGRLDAFATVRFLLFPDESRGFPFTAPVSVSHLWGTGTKKWLHWNNNTNATLQRNIAQALGMGAVAGKGSIHNVLVPNLLPLERASEATTSPTWPSDVFGPLNSALVERGELLYEARCASCHDAGKVDPASGLIEYPLFSLSQTGTDPNDALNFHQPVGPTPFPKALSERLQMLQTWYFYRRDPRNPVPRATQTEWGGGTARLPPVWRDPLAKGIDAPVYAALPLDGVWATAPYLHNNSVPTLRDLLRPTKDRPVRFRVGHRDYDPVNVGYVQPADLNGVDPLEVFDTREDGNSNAGHDGPLFGAEGLTEDDVRALLEYLKSL
jgi:mono/diheme cytochrome c family protein